jgi:hypothetical protein
MHQDLGSIPYLPCFFEPGNFTTHQWWPTKTVAHELCRVKSMKGFSIE